MHTDILGSSHDKRDQGRCMIFSAVAWFTYLVLITVADFIPKTSLFAPLTRLGSVLCMITVIVSMFGALPRFLSLAKNLIAIFGLAGCLFQTLAIMDLLSTQPEISGFFNTVIVSQILYNLALFPFAYCIYRHPMFPRWLGIAMVFDGVFWVIFYWLMASNAFLSPWGYLIMVPFLAIELTTGVLYIRNGLQLSRTAVA